jgi:2-polyprenyl-6-methoxyphenol hydroxylase-like FAD-dependent oxidoreductase
MLVVRAGLVGLLVALCLGQAGIPTVVLESHHTLLPTTLAMVYMPVIIPFYTNSEFSPRPSNHAPLNREGAAR